MNSLQIAKYLKRDDDFIGVYSVDTLPKKLIDGAAKMIVNLDKSSDSGSHWTAIFISKYDEGFYFDPLGQKPPDEIQTFIERNCQFNFRVNENKYQGDVSSLCGQFCIIFLYYCPNIEEFQRKIFPCQVKNNERNINKLMKRFF